MVYSHWLGPELGLGQVPGRMGTRPILQVLKMFPVFFPVPVQVQCERFLLKPYNPFFLVPVPVPVLVLDQASVNTPLDGLVCISSADPGFCQGGPQVRRPKVTSVAKWSCMSKVSYLCPGSRATLRALEVFGFSMLKCIFLHFRDSFLLFSTSNWTSEIDKNSVLYCN